MSPADEQELLRLTSLLESIDKRLDLDAGRREALKKAAVALSVTFIHGLRPEVERLYASLPKRFGEAEREQLRRLGIDPDRDPDS